MKETPPFTACPSALTFHPATLQVVDWFSSPAHQWLRGEVKGGGRVRGGGRPATSAIFTPQPFCTFRQDLDINYTSILRSSSGFRYLFTFFSLCFFYFGGPLVPFVFHRRNLVQCVSTSLSPLSDEPKAICVPFCSLFLRVCVQIESVVVFVA